MAACVEFLFQETELCSQTRKSGKSILSFSTSVEVKTQQRCNSEVARCYINGNKFVIIFKRSVY